MTVKTLAMSIVLGITTSVAPAFADDQTHVPVSAPLPNTPNARGGEAALRAVVRVICQSSNSSGTAFLHSSGRFITAAHVVANCPQPVLIAANGSSITGGVEAQDADLDLALINVPQPLPVAPLPLSTSTTLQIGEQLSAWGYPGGYNGLAPMLTVGYLSAVDARKTPSGRVVKQWVVNAAFNSGNSGGPLIDTQDGSVIGIVDAKLAPLSESSLNAIKALSSMHSGVMYSATNAKGESFQVTEGQVVGQVLDDLQRQVQLVIGYAVILTDLRSFLTAHGIEP